jgi:hypothetical protein
MKLRHVVSEPPKALLTRADRFIIRHHFLETNALVASSEALLCVPFYVFLLGFPMQYTFTGGTWL